MELWIQQAHDQLDDQFLPRSRSDQLQDLLNDDLEGCVSVRGSRMCGSWVKEQLEMTTDLQRLVRKPDDWLVEMRTTAIRQPDDQDRVK
jgi:hypothetical protein